MKSERIHNRYSLMKYKNDPSNPIMIDIDVDASDSIRITPIPTIAKPGVLTQRSRSKPVSTVKPIQKEVSIQGLHSGHSDSVEVLHEIRSKQKCDPHSNSLSPVHGYTKSDIRKMLFTSKEKQQPSRDESDFKDPHPVISQNKRKSPPLVTAKVVQHQEKKLEQMWPALKQLRQKLKSRNWRTEKQRREFMWKEYLSSIGFGQLLNIKVDGSASRIGYYVVNNFDPERMVLNVDQGEIPITRQLINDMLGLPLGNININSLKFTPAEDKTVDFWSAQFKSENDIRPKGVQRVIKRLKDVGLLFKVNFLVLICNTLGQSKSMGTCDVSMLSRVSADLDLSNIDLCSYVLECLKNTKHAWNSMSDTSYYVGPIVLLTVPILQPNLLY
ncbi:unnamed protein product [Lactuca virosa]|uniref:Uncharacterized protein n=1 Tax=Lactuca virosa TaxID=75947 RepID=A0AAU9LM77_9ASTR|nr:unnamed protein product [Lactuca virosa]